MRKAITFIKPTIKKRLGGEPVLSILEACHAIDEARREALQEAISIAEQHGDLKTASALRRLAEERPSGGANDG